MKNLKSDKIFYNLSISLLTGLFLIFCLSFAGFIIKIPVNPFYPVFGLILTVVLNYLLGKKYNFSLKEYIVSYAILFISIIFFYFLSNTFWDYSYDGREYHQAGVILLKNGYNPIYNTAQSVFDKVFGFNYEIPLWVDCYPKFSEILCANVYSLTNKIESAKMINYIISFIVFGYSYYILKKYFNSKFNWLYSLLITLNPVVISGVSTFCNDGLVYNFFVISLLSIIDLYKTKEIKPQMILFMSVIMLSNIKFGGAFYAFLLLILGFKYLKKPLITLSVMLLLLVLSGINPYITNTVNFGNPLYPIAGKNKIDIMTKNTPKQFVGKSMGFKLFWSTFAKSDNFLNKQNTSIYLKLPFTFSYSELSKQSYENTRICGFGVLWSGIVLLSFVGIFFVKKENLKLLLFLLLTVLLMPHNWWARYVPQFYLIPIFIAMFINPNKHILKGLITLSLVFNLIFYSFSIIRFQVLPFYVFCQNNIPIFDQKSFSLYDFEKITEKGIQINFNEN